MIWIYLFFLGKGSSIYSSNALKKVSMVVAGLGGGEEGHKGTKWKWEKYNKNIN